MINVHKIYGFSELQIYRFFVKAVVEKELNRKIEEAFAFFDSNPLAAASIGQVHEAILLTGEKVVVKVLL